MVQMEKMTQVLGAENGKRLKVATWVKAFEGVVVAAMPITAAYCVLLSETEKTLTPVFISIVAFIAIIAIRRIIGWPATREIYEQSYNGGLLLRTKILNHLVALPLGAFKKLSAGRIAQTLSEDMIWFETYFAFAGPNRKADIVNVGALIVAGLIISWQMTLAYVITVAVGMFFLARLKKLVDRGFVFRSQGVSDASSHVIEYVQGMPVVRAFGDTDEAEREYKRYVEIMHKGFRSAVFRNFPLATGFTTVVTLAVSFAAIAGLQVFDWQNESSFFSFTAGLLVLASTIVPVQAFLAYTLIISLAQITQKNVANIQEMSTLPSGERVELPKDFSIEFDNVSFSYDKERTAVENIAFKAEPSTITAIVGKSGSGKTTLMNLLMRFWDVTDGHVRLNGKDVREYDTGFLLDQMATVFQENILFKDTIANNIRVGRPDATDEEVQAAAKLAQVDKLINSLPNGYETMVGVSGARLSGGEKQRIAIARAILKDSSIVILDEATSALDPENENEIQAAFSGLAKDKTVFVIAHRLSTIVNADNILVLDEGKLIDQGKHDELIKRCKYYRRLWDLHKSSEGWVIEH